METDQHDYDFDINEVSKKVSNIRARLDNIDTIIADALQCKNSASKHVLLATIRKYLANVTIDEQKREM